MSEVVIKDYAALLRSIREGKDISQNGLARLLGVNQSSVSCWETGRKEPTADSLLRWVHALGYEVMLVPRDRLIR